MRATARGLATFGVTAAVGSVLLQPETEQASDAETNFYAPAENFLTVFSEMDASALEDLAPKLVDLRQEDLIEKGF